MKTFSLKTEFIDEPDVHIVRKGKYAYQADQWCFHIESPNETIAILSTPVPEYGSLADDECFVKDYSENRGIQAALIKQSILLPLKSTIIVPVGYALVQCFRINKEYLS